MKKIIKIKKHEGIMIYNKSRRIFRGLFRSNKGKLINVDLNAFYQIIRKVFPKAFVEEIEGVRLHPIRVNIAYAIFTDK